MTYPRQPRWARPFVSGGRGRTGRHAHESTGGRSPSSSCDVSCRALEPAQKHRADDKDEAQRREREPDGLRRHRHAEQDALSAGTAPHWFTLRRYAHSGSRSAGTRSTLKAKAASSAIGSAEKLRSSTKTDSRLHRTSSVTRNAVAGDPALRPRRELPPFPVRAYSGAPE